MLTFTKTKQIKTQVQMNILIFNYYQKVQRTLHFQTNVIFLFQDSGFKAGSSCLYFLTLPAREINDLKDHPHETLHY